MENAVRARVRGHTCLDAILGGATCGTGVKESSEVRAVTTYEGCSCCFCCCCCDGDCRPCLLRR